MNAAVAALLAPEVRPFAIAGAIMIVLAAIEMASTLIGFSISHVFGKDVDLDAHSDNPVAGLVSWVNAGRVPLLVLLFLMLGIFSMAGFALEGVALGAGIALPVWVAVLIAIAVTIPIVRVVGRAIARIIPRDETYTVSEADFVGQLATVAVGPLDQGLPGRVRLKDVFGNWHNVAARASRESPPLAMGASVLLVDRDAKSFIAIAAPADLSAQQPSSNEK